MDNLELLSRRLKHHIFHSKQVPVNSIALYNKVYAFWNGTWKKTLGELENLERLYADDFLRQGEVSALTLDDEVISYFAYSWFDLRQEAALDHSYFKAYPREILDSLKQKGFNKVMTMGWLAVAPQWRRSKVGPLICDTTLWQGYERFLSSDADALIAYTRNDRKINTACYRYGSRCLREKLTSHNVEVDLIWTLKEDVKPHPDEQIRATCSRLWQQRTVHVSAPVVTEKVAA